ncbi:MAG TPA: class I adenylate-forming enzyme family protein [Acidimicrobiia bacterium]|nr:class I adenylate-forming enzyme family protein [Acidimicrobiia bacterium]
MTDRTGRFVWGNEIVRRDGGIPFLVYEPRRTDAAQLLEDVAHFGDRIHLVRGGQRLSYSELLDLVPKAAAVLADHGVGPGERVMLIAFNSVEWIVAFWATLFAGAVVVLANPWWSEPELRHGLGLVDVRLVLADPRSAKLVPDDAAVPVLELGAMAEEAAAAERAPLPRPPLADEDDPALILFTSGTSGPPKGAVLPHRSVIALQHSLLAVTRLLPHTLSRESPREVALQTGPLFHIGGVQALVRQLLLGGTLVFPAGRFDPTEVLDLIETEGVHRWGGVPTMVSRVLNDPSIEGRDLSSVRAISLGGAPVLPELVTRVKSRFPNVERGVSQVYGLSEGGGTLTAASGRDLTERPGTAGRALPITELRIADADEHGAGEVLARTPTQMLGYWGQTGNAAVIDDEGWVHTGDLGRLDADGYLYITGRLKDLIIRGGENIASTHVEDILLKHPGVREVAVCGRPDPDLGEIVAAAVVVDPGTPVTVAELRSFAAEHLAYFEVPSAWWLRTEPLPANDVGKVRKQELLATWPPGGEGG